MLKTGLVLLYRIIITALAESSPTSLQAEPAWEVDTGPGVQVEESSGVPGNVPGPPSPVRSWSPHPGGRHEPLARRQSVADR